LFVFVLVCQTAFSNETKSPRFVPEWVASARLDVWTRAAAPAFAPDDVNGGRRRPDDFRGRVVLRRFFATWCAPCVEEFTSPQKRTDETRDRPIAVAEAGVRVRNFVAKPGVHFPVPLDRDRAITKAWGRRQPADDDPCSIRLCATFRVEDARRHPRTVTA